MCAWREISNLPNASAPNSNSQDKQLFTDRHTWWWWTLNNLCEQRLKLVIPVWVTFLEQLLHWQQKLWHISTNPSTKQQPVSLHTDSQYIVSGKKVNLQTLYNRNVRSEQIWIKFHTLNRQYTAESITKFHQNISFLTAVINNWISITKYLLYQYRVT